MTPPARLLTCGARIRIAPHLVSAADEQRAAGLPRVSVQCPLAAHDRGPHWGILREASRVPHPGRPTWTSWTAETASATGPLTAHSLPACQHTPACCLFADHPGPCSPHLDPALREDPTRPSHIDTALALLTAHADTGRGRDEVAQAAHDAALLTWDELRARPRIFKDLPEGDLATVHRLVSRSASVPALPPEAVKEFVREAAEATRLWFPGSSRRLPHGGSAGFWLGVLERLPPAWQAAALSDRPAQILPPDNSPQRQSLVKGPGPRIVFHEVLEHARRQAASGQNPPTTAPDWESGHYREQDHKLGADLAGRLASLPYGWRVDAVRRIARGTPTLTALSEPAQAINILRSYGIRLAWNTPQSNPT